jgi:mannitol-specific phosphotransferase system IIBC component
VKRASNLGKIFVAIFCGLVVGAIAGAIHWMILPHDQSLLVHVMLGDLVAALTSMIVCLAIQLRQEEVHFASAMSRAAIVSELNHHVRNAVFPLCLAVQKSGDKDASQLANEAVERINVALKEATADAISGRSSYADDIHPKNGSLLVH